MIRRLRINFSLLILASLIGLLLGLGGYTFIYAQGFSYFSDKPEVCVNCHIMRNQYESWEKSSHHAAASCNGCHVPHDIIGKYLSKAENGYHHSKAFTTQNFHEPIMIRAKNAEVLGQNCRSCHAEFISQTAITAHSAKDKMDCVRCHRNVGHAATEY